eukprot:TRINITY_DN836_c0_g1_i3.p1 TRINITY_DN836_c0_g1~~TRINITY_DN836_c0_g1_i3.p1  ORF type:complete len:703 (-),score=104.12 TRINITY_DN836_c0_g1_i3:60-2168(-)
MPIPTTPIEWTEEYAVHIPLIDDQHRTLFDMIEQLRLAALRSDDRGEVGSVLKGLITYCVEHFDSEELVMQDIGYPVYKSHAAVHQQFTDRCIEWVNAYAEGQLEVEYVVDYLTHWLVNHILHSDKKIEAFCNEHNIDASCITSIADVLPPEENPKDLSRGPSLTHRLAIPLTVAFILSSVAVFIALASPDWGWELNRSIAAACALQGTTFPLFFALIYHIRHYLANHERVAKAMHARQLADNLLAGEIASRIAVMDLDSMAELFQGNTNSSLVMQLQCIVENLQIFRPYIPATVFALLRPKDEEEDDKADKRRATSQSPVRRNSHSSHSSPTSENQRRFLPGTTEVHEMETSSVNSGDSAPLGIRVHSSPNKQAWAARAKSVSSKGSKSTRSRATAAHTKLSLVRGLKRRAVTVLVADITGFHNLVQGTDTDHLLAYHAAYVGSLKESVERVKGVINSISGDHVLCSWNACTAVGNHSALACQAALEIQRELSKDENSSVSLRVAVAVASGAARVGNMGTDKKIDFMVVSPVVHLAFAMCKLNKQLATNVLIENSCWSNCCATFQAELVTALQPAMREWPGLQSTADATNIFELKGQRVLNDDDEWMYTLEQGKKEDPYTSYNAGVAAFFLGQWEEAHTLLSGFSEKQPTHSRAQHFLRQCQQQASADSARPPLYMYGWHMTPALPRAPVRTSVVFRDTSP